MILGGLLPEHASKLGSSKEKEVSNLAKLSMRQASWMPLKRSAALFFGRSCYAGGVVLS